MSTVENSQMLTPQEVAEILGIHPKTVHLWLRTGKLEGVKISYRSWRIPKAASAAFIEKNRNVKSSGTDINEGLNFPDKNEANQIKNPRIEENSNPEKTNMKLYIRDIMRESEPT